MDDSARQEELRHLTWAIADMSRLESSGHLGNEGRLLLQRYRDWYAWLSSPVPAAAPPPPPAAGASAPPSPGIDLRRLIGTHGVLLLSWAGALLLISATVLFLAYGPEGIHGGGRAAAVLGLNAVLAAIAVVCHRRAALRLVAETYLALTALTLPLSLAALYGYVLRDQTGMTAPAALALGGALCAVVYERIASLLRSEGYATLSLAMATTAAVNAPIALGLGSRALPATAAIALAGWLLAGRSGSPFARPGRVLAIAATVGGPWAALAVASHQAAATTPRELFLPVTFAAVAAVSLHWALRRGSAAMGWASVLLASATPLAVAWCLGAGGGALDLTLALTALGTAGVAALPWSLLGRAAFGDLLPLGLAEAVALLATLEAVGAAWRSTGVDVDVVAAAAATLAGVMVTLRRGEGAHGWLGLGPAPVAAVALGALDRAADTLPEHWPAGVPSGLAVVLAATALLALRRRAAFLLPWLSVGVTVAGLTAVSAWQLGVSGYAASLVLLGVLQAIVTPAMPEGQRTLSSWGAGVRLAISATVVVSPLWLQALLAAGALGGAVVLAATTRRAVAGVLAVALAAAAWYWVGSAIAGAPLGRHTAAAALLPLAALIAVTVALGRDRLRTAGGDLDAGLWIGTGVLVVVIGELGFGSTGIVLGLTLLAGLARGRVGLGLAALAGFWALGTASGADGGIAGVDVSLALSGMLATLATAALLATGRSGLPPRVGMWSAIVVGAASLDWLSLAAHLGEAQAYAVAPAIALICCGLGARGDRPPDGSAEVATTYLTGGLVLLLGSSGLEALVASSGSWYLPLLLGEAIAVLIVAVVAESRLSAAAAGAALAGVCLRALGIAASSLPLYAVFGGCALLLLAGSVGLALERERVARLRQTLGRWGR